MNVNQIAIFAKIFHCVRNLPCFYPFLGDKLLYVGWCDIYQAVYQFIRKSFDQYSETIDSPKSMFFHKSGRYRGMKWCKSGKGPT